MSSTRRRKRARAHRARQIAYLEASDDMLMHDDMAMALSKALSEDDVPIVEPAPRMAKPEDNKPDDETDLPF